MMANTNLQFIGMPEQGIKVVKVVGGSAVLENDNDTAILAISFRWQYTRGGMNPTQESVDRTYLNWMEGRDPVVAPHAKFNASVKDLMDPSLSEVSGVASVIAVMFSDGRFFGDREAGMARELKARWAAENDIYVPFLEKVDRLPEQAFAEVQDLRDRVATHRGDYPFFYPHYVSLFAQELLDLRQRPGIEAAKSRAKERESFKLAKNELTN